MVLTMQPLLVTQTLLRIPWPASCQGSVRASAMAALVCNFDVIVLSDAVIDLEGQPVTWLDEAEAAGAMIKKTADTWLRM